MLDAILFLFKRRERGSIYKEAAAKRGYQSLPLFSYCLPLLCCVRLTSFFYRLQSQDHQPASTGLYQCSSNKMQSPVIGLAVFFSFYILLLYLVDIFVRRRNTDHSRIYYVFRLLIALLFLGADIVLLILSKRMLAAFYGLQGLSLLLSFIIQVYIFLLKFKYFNC